MNVIDSQLCLRNSFGKLFSPVFVASIVQCEFLPSVFHMVMMCTSKVCLGGVFLDKKIKNVASP
jgi:hypothetical protein